MTLEAPKLENWVTLPEAAGILGISPQAVHNLAEAGYFSSLRGVGSKPLFIVMTAEVESLRDRREEIAEQRQEKLVERDRSKALRRAAGRPQLDYPETYEEAQRRINAKLDADDAPDPWVR